MTEDRTLIISLGRVKECLSRQARRPDKQVVWSIAEKENVEEKQQKQDQGHIPGTCSVQISVTKSSKVCRI